jgi:hypothetical protein
LKKLSPIAAMKGPAQKRIGPFPPQIKVHIVDIRELHRQAVRVSPIVLEIHSLQTLCCYLLKLLLGGALFLSHNRTRQRNAIQI